ncbi:MAG: hypothetical protein AABZ32_03030 [Bacteroidota bacterium]
MKLKKTIRAEFQLPRATWNKAFTKTFSGVFNSGISMNVGRKHFSAGGFYSLTQYQVFPKYYDDPHVIQTNHTAGIKLHYDMLTSTGNGMFSPFISPGYSWIKYTRIKVKNHPSYNTQTSAASVNVGASYNIMIDEWVGVGFIAGFNMIDHVYRPENVSLDEWGMDYSPDDKRGSFKNIFFGFSLYYDLARKPETDES